jgi:YVTN family beta-propeller protein
MPVDGCHTRDQLVPNQPRSPFNVAVNPSTNTIYTANFFGNTASVISGQTNTVVATIAVGRSPRPAVNPKTGLVYVANNGDNTVSVLSPCPK